MRRGWVSCLCVCIWNHARPSECCSRPVFPSIRIGEGERRDDVVTGQRDSSMMVPPLGGIQSVHIIIARIKQASRYPGRCQADFPLKGERARKREHVASLAEFLTIRNVTLLCSRKRVFIVGGYRRWNFISLARLS